MSTRFTFREADAGWSEYIAFVGLPYLKEVRSLDSSLNRYVNDCGSCQLRSLDDLSDALSELPRPSDEREYYLLFLDVQNEKLPSDATGLRLLGHDLSDETHTSSLLNCGPWTGQLVQFTYRQNKYGLLTFDDAVAAKSLLPQEWPGDPHAEVTVWALYELTSAE